MARKPNVNLKSKTAKYFVAHRIKGKTKTEAFKEAGLSDIRNVTNIERTQTYQALEEKYKDHMLKHLGLDQVAAEHATIILQNENLAAKTAAIKLFLERVEPEQKEQVQEDQMVVVLRTK